LASPETEVSLIVDLCGRLGKRSAPDASVVPLVTASRQHLVPSREPMQKIGHARPAGVCKHGMHTRRSRLRLPNASLGARKVKVNEEFALQVGSDLYKAPKSTEKHSPKKGRHKRPQGSCSAKDSRATRRAACRGARRCRGQQVSQLCTSRRHLCGRKAEWIPNGKSARSLDFA